jgi:hypothetical protein
VISIATVPGVPECEHRSISEEAYTAPAYDHRRMTRTTVYLCGWPDAHLKNAPRWVKKSIGGGMMIHPELDCRNCPALAKAEHPHG